MDELDEWITPNDRNHQLFEEPTETSSLQKVLNVIEKIDEDATRERIKRKLRLGFGSTEE